MFSNSQKQKQNTGYDRLIGIGKSQKSKYRIIIRSADYEGPYWLISIPYGYKKSPIGANIVNPSKWFEPLKNFDPHLESFEPWFEIFYLVNRIGIGQYEKKDIGNLLDSSIWKKPYRIYPGPKYHSRWNIKIENMYQVYRPNFQNRSDIDF